MLSLRLPNSTWFALAIAGVMFPAHDCLAAAGQPVYYGVPRGAHPHDVAAAPVPGGPVYYTAQATGKVGVLDHQRQDRNPSSTLGAARCDCRADSAAWITDGGQNAIVRYDQKTRQVRVWPLPRTPATPISIP
jgi:virginiamycin B lyase